MVEARTVEVEVEGAMSGRRRPGGARKMKAFSRVENLTSSNAFDRALRRRDQLVLVEFVSNYSPSSKSMAPYMQTLSKTAEFKRIRFCRVDIEAVPAVAERCNVKALPTYQLYKNGEKLEEMSGALPSKLVTMLKEHNVRDERGGVLKLVGVVLGVVGALAGVLILKHRVEQHEIREEARRTNEETTRLAKEQAEREERQRRRGGKTTTAIAKQEEEEEEEFEEFVSDDVEWEDDDE